ncbi:hypothetical protein HPB48_023574 [Haemaphysalis longicornis]|uniref:Uncharacterized protein n=1 Tax=Haemaphysalis longicornis TaxID=44386 RepID=A0A9J6H893_HAELO|nr:hypothetical protein HPB48_023574 [Haemaphysalis longicornis]
MIETLSHFSQQVGRMLARVANRRQGMPESILLRRARTFIVAKFAYAIPYLELSKLEAPKVDALLRKTYKQALGLPPTTSTALFSALGAQNTVAKLQK